jgi:PEP-CTERM motif-containing protein
MTRLASIAAAAALGIMPLAGLAQTYDINQDFSLAANPNGVWSYGFIDASPIPAFHLYDQPDPNNGAPAWRSSLVQSFFAPADANNATDVTLGLAPPHTAAFHPGPNGELSVFRFTTPTSGTYSLVSTFGALDTGGTDVHVLENGTSLFDHAINTSPANVSASFSTMLSLTAGDIIDFTVGDGGNGFFSDSTSINATITSAVPEPQTYAMLAVGLGLLGFMVRRRA